ncbi:Fc.00g022720.m01.CDS01 [Cosmosporella sp. VM-42]
MANNITHPFPSVEETLKHPAYRTTIWALEPHSGGKATVAKNRGGPLNIAWEIHGSGPTKLVLIMGLAGVKTSWQRQTKYFGHDHGDKYSVLILDNRGMGKSDKPLGAYSTSGMALDVIETLDAVGWTGEREINLVGISLGGMIAQEVAMVIPERLQSLSLLCTSASIESTKSLQATVTERLGFFIPKSMERTIADTATQLFSQDWLLSLDAEVLPIPGETPHCNPSPWGNGNYLLFDNNFQRFQAQELVKRLDKNEYSSTGLMCQLLAAGWHKKTDEQLEEIAERVGRERIMVMHGTRDNMITVNNGEKLMRVMKPGVGLVVEGLGHAPVMERTGWFNSVLEERLGAWTKIE